MLRTMEINSVKTTVKLVEVLWSNVCIFSPMKGEVIRGSVMESDCLGLFLGYTTY